MLFITGSAIGSFLNVVIDRIPSGRSIVTGRSACDFCKKQLAWYDLIPVFSFFMIGGRCRYCRKKLSWQYPLIELIAGLMLPLLYMYVYSKPVAEMGTSHLILIFCIYTVLVFGFLVIFVTDLKYRIIPDYVLLPLTAVSLILHLVFHPAAILTYFLSGFIIFLLFLLLVIITRGKGMGLGDVKYAFFMGFLLGSPGIIIAFYLAFLTGAGISLILIIASRKKIKDTIPFGPFLVIATVITLFYGQTLWMVLLRLLRIV